MNAAALEEWARAPRCPASAEVLLGCEDPDSSVSRSYQAVFRAESAFLLAEGREFGKHEAVESAVHRDLVRSGRVAVAFGASYTRLRELRMIGDHGVDAHVESEDAEDALQRAREIVHVLRGLSGGRLG